MKKKKFQEMTEEEILDYVASAIPGYLKQIRPHHGEFIPNDCVARQVKALKQLFRQSRELEKTYKTRLRDNQELDVTIGFFLPRIREQARIAQMQYRKEQTTWTITATLANELIKNAFDEAGMDCQTEYQRYRAKVLINLDGRTLRFYIGYKALEQADTLPGIVRAVLDLKDAADRIGGDVKLGR